MTSDTPLDPKTAAEYDRLMTLAQVNRRRGDYVQAAEQVAQASALWPESLDAQELAADILYAQGKWEEALERYKAIRQRDPSRASAEEKFARITVQIAEGKRQQELMKQILENPGVYLPPKRNPAVAAVLSGIAGLGHVYCGNLKKGAVLFASTTLCWLAFLSLTPPIAPYPSAADRIVRFTQDLGVLAWIFLLLAVVLQMYAIVNAATTAEQMNSQQNGIL